MKTLLTSPDQVRARDGFDNARTFLAPPNAFVRPQAVTEPQTARPENHTTRAARFLFGSSFHCQHPPLMSSHNQFNGLERDRAP
jgi:hypothetical protein